MLRLPPPSPPYWPAYPEPERTALRTAYEHERAAYCASFNREALVLMAILLIPPFAVLGFFAWA